MKSSIPLPVVIIAVVAVLALVGVFIYRGMNQSTTEVGDVVKQVNVGKPTTEAVPASTAAGDAMLMGGKKGGR
jgi:hypothetical protein